MNELQAELLGMHAGDGTLYRTNSNCLVWELRGGLVERDYYIRFVDKLLASIFGTSFKSKYRSGGSFGIQTSKREITGFIAGFFPIGEKSSRVRIPPIIFDSSESVKRAFLRGYFDTDGCIRFDRQPRLSYPYPKIEFSTASAGMLRDVVALIEELGMGCHTWKSRNYHKVCIPGKKNLIKWRSMVSSNNPKHLNKLY